MAGPGIGPAIFLARWVAGFKAEPSPRPSVSGDLVAAGISAPCHRSAYRNTSLSPPVANRHFVTIFSVNAFPRARIA